MTRESSNTDVQHRIVLSARKLVAERGVHASTMRQIARDAGVTTGAVTHYFADKVAVMIAVLKYNNKLLGSRVARAGTGKRGLAALEASVDALLPLDDESLRCWTVLFAFWGYGPAQEFARSAGPAYGYEALSALVVACLRDAVALGELPGDLDLEHEGERILALVGGIGLMVGGFPGYTAPIRERARRLLAEQLAALTKDS